MSGRSLRRLPVLAHARFIGGMATLPPRPHGDSRTHVNGVNGKLKKAGGGTDVSLWLDAMDKVVVGQATERDRLHQ